MRCRCKPPTGAGDSIWSDSEKDTPLYGAGQAVAGRSRPATANSPRRGLRPADGGSAITGYTIRHSVAGANSWTTSGSQTNRTYEMDNLTNGTEYEVQVQATNAAGDSGYSDSVKETPCTVPSKPSPTLTSGDRKLTASWSAPADGGCDITGYKVRHSVTGANSWTTSSSQTGTSLEIGSLTNGTEYDVQVQATNSAGDSGWSDSAKAKPYTVPDKPSPTLTSADQKLTVSWSAPSDGGSAITGYTIRHSVAGANSWTTSGSQTGTSLEIGSLTNGTEYDVQVQATNAAGDSGYSDSVTAKPCTAPSKPAAPSLTSGDQKLTASWSAPSNNGGCDITGYKVRHSVAGANSWTTSSSQTGTSLEIGSLTNGTEYDVQVQAANSAGDGIWSDSAKAKPYTVPSKPSPSLASSDQKLTVSWSAPSDGGSAITGYTIRHSVAGANSWTTSGSQTGTSLEIGSLTNGTEYDVQVQATNAAGDSGYSDSATAKPCTVPSKPAAPSLTVGNAKLTASWSAPSNNGGCDITGYKVQHRATGTSTWTTSSSQTGDLL